jgi:hypothetical protein
MSLAHAKLNAAERSWNQSPGKNPVYTALGLQLHQKIISNLVAIRVMSLRYISQAKALSVV